MREIYLVRHGSVHNPDNVTYRREPGFRLSERGVREAQETADFLSGRGIEAVFHSPMERCVQTASIISSVLGVPVIESQEANEWDQDESLRDVQARMNTLWMMLYAQPYETVAIVSHRDPIRALMLGLAGRKLSQIYEPEVFPVKPGEVWLLKTGSEPAVFEGLFTPRAGQE